jgi:hypothetical protein
LHEQHPFAANGQSFNGFSLAVSERDTSPTGEPLECSIKIVCHLVRVRMGCDTVLALSIVDLPESQTEELP